MIKYFLLPFLLLMLSTIFKKILVLPKFEEERLKIIQNKLFYTVFILYVIVFGTLSILKYISLHTTFFDLGVFEHTVWSIAYKYDFYLISVGHFSPVLFVYAVFYKLFPSGITLLLLQTIIIAIGSWPLYKISEKHLKIFLPLVVVLSYFLYFGVEYNNLFDFHTDHFFMTLLLFGFYFLEEKNIKGFITISVISLFIKEPLLLSLSLFGLYAVIKHKYYKSGIFVSVSSLFLFVVVTQIIIPFYSKNEYGFISSIAFTKFGSGFLEITKNIVLHPGLVVSELFFSKEKLIYLFCIFAPLLFIPLLSPLALLPSLPMILIAILSQVSNYYSSQSHYFASIIPGLFVAFIYGLEKLEKIKGLVIYVLVIAIYFNVLLGSSPLSLTFWKGTDWMYSKTAYIITYRDKMINNAIKKYIPVNHDVSVTTQNSVNSSLLVKRVQYLFFPFGLESSDYVVLDFKRPLFVGDIVDKEKFQEMFNIVLKTHEIIFKEDGFYILSKKSGLVKKDKP